MAAQKPSMVSLVARAVLFAAFAGFALPALPGDLRLETMFTKPVAYGNAPLFEGCSPAKAPDDPVALRMAVLQARANLSRSRNLNVGGVEKLVVNNGAQHLVDQVREISEGFQAPVSIVEKYDAKHGDDLHVCVVIIEDSAR